MIRITHLHEQFSLRLVSCVFASVHYIISLYCNIDNLDRRNTNIAWCVKLYWPSEWYLGTHSLPLSPSPLTAGHWDIYLLVSLKNPLLAAEKSRPSYLGRRTGIFARSSSLAEQKFAVCLKCHNWFHINLHSSKMVLLRIFVISIAYSSL